MAELVEVEFLSKLEQQLLWSWKHELHQNYRLTRYIEEVQKVYIVEDVQVNILLA
jgi:tRNA U34 5-methylaminomethyl-2-thiouridine-forming methyltransferase MnmC